VAANRIWPRYEKFKAQRYKMGDNRIGDKG